MKDERYCKKKLAQFKKEYSQPNAYQDSPAASKEDPGSSQLSQLQPGSSERTEEDSPIVNGTNNVANVNDEESVKSTPASGSSPRKRCREFEGKDQCDENEDMTEVSCGWGPQKRSKSDSPATSPPMPSPVLQTSISTNSGSLKSGQGVTGTVNLSLPVMGTPTKREREEGEDRDGDIDMKDMLDERVVKKVRSRSSSPSRGFEVKLYPAVVHTGA